ncbi:MAG TPA: class I SAM-dependent methyltransferase family protein [archaeon]|nr:class I SAM-dependent methyltransferase family protein [archaeon]
MSLKDSLKKRLTAEELAEVRRAFDLIGDVAIVEIPERLRRKERLIARAVMEAHPMVRTVLAKAGKREGELRTRKLRAISGKGTVTEHVEHGCRYRLDVRTVYFSPREATERLRVAAQVKAGELVLVPFAGCGPFAILIAKRQPSAQVVGVELGKEAAGYFQENAFLNRVAERVSVVCGDFKKEAGRFRGFDRVLLPLPADGWKFLPEALRTLKAGGMVHFYAFEGEDTMRFDPQGRVVKLGQSEGRLETAARGLGRKIAVTGRARVHAYAPGVWKVCVDARVL